MGHVGYVTLIIRAIFTALSAGCAIVQVEGDGDVKSRSLYFLVPPRIEQSAISNSAVIRTLHAGLSNFGDSYGLGVSARTTVTFQDTSRCAQVLILSSVHGDPRPVDALRATLPRGCVVSLMQ